jgi:predicted CoA-binding protein
MDKNYTQVLKKFRIVLLVDWPNPGVPLSLLKAGFIVIGYSPDSYSLASIEAIGDKKEKLVFKKLDQHPDEVDIVNIFRPEEEHSAIIDRHVLPLKAKVIWLQPPVSSVKTAKLAIQNGLIFVEGEDIAAAATRLK